MNSKVNRSNPVELRPINAIARDIFREWKNVNYAAKPYLEAMCDLTDKFSRYGADDATGIILYFLNNASSFRGGNAKNLKAELKLHLK